MREVIFDLLSITGKKAIVTILPEVINILSVISLLIGSPLLLFRCWLVHLLSNCWLVHLFCYLNSGLPILVESIIFTQVSSW